MLRGSFLRSGLSELGVLDDVVCVVEVVKAVLAVRDAGQPSLPHHLLREGEVGSSLFQVLVLEMCVVLWAEAEGWRSTRDRGTLLAFRF